MRINILNDGHRNCGGCLQLIKYAHTLADLGHDVRLVYDGSFSFDLIPVRVRRVYAPMLAPGQVPDADAVICSSWYMAGKLCALPASKGEKFYYLQDFENWSGASEDIIGSWRLPTHKIAVARYLEDMVSRHTGLQADRIPYGIDFELFFADRKTPPQDELVVGGLYNTMARKRFPDLLEVVRRLRSDDVPVRLRLFGAEPRPTLDLEFDYLHKPDPETLRKMYEDCHIWLAMSNQEGLHIPPMEAMACGAVVVATDIGGMRDYVLPGRTGWRVEVGDVDAARNHVAALFRNPERWQELSQGATDHIRAMGSEKDNCRRMVELFTHRIAQRHEGRPKVLRLAEASPNAWRTLEVCTAQAETMAARSDNTLAGDLARELIRVGEELAGASPIPLALNAKGRFYGTALRLAHDLPKPNSDQAQPLSVGLERSFRFNPQEVDALKQVAATAGLRITDSYSNPARFDGHLRIYPTLACNLRCAWCVNDQVEDGRRWTGQVTPAQWAEAINREGRHVVLTGGEPFLYPGLVKLINAVDRHLQVRVYTNLGLELAEQIHSLDREVHFYVSWHPRAKVGAEIGSGADSEANRDIFLRNTEAILASPLRALEVHAIKADEDKNRLEQDLEFFKQQGLHIYLDEDQRAFTGARGAPACQAFCRRRIYLLGPDGNRYQCVSKLMRRADPMENILDGPLEQDLCFTLCPDYGRCAPCDGLGETDIHVTDS